MNIKKYYNIFVAIALLVLTYACANKNEDAKPMVVPTAKGTFKDDRDGAQYQWVRYGNLEWMVENMRYDTQDRNNSTFYQSYGWQPDNSLSKDNVERYGFLYTLLGAKLAVPIGWRIPTDDDWSALESILGMSPDQIKSREWRGNKEGEILKKSDSGLSVKMAGYYTPYTTMGTIGYRFMGSYAFFWTNSPDVSKSGDYYFYRKLFYNSEKIYRESMESNKAMLSLRLVRDVAGK